MSYIHAALEIGTTQTVLAIAEGEPRKHLNVISYAAIPSSGVRKSQIIDINHVTQSIQSVLRTNEKNQLAKGNSVTIATAILVVSGQHIKVDPSQGMIQIQGSKVTTNDIKTVTEAAKSMPLPNDREPLEVAEQTYEIDSFRAISDPLGLSGRILKLNTLHIHADKNRIDDARTAANEAHLEIDETLFATTCAADAVLTEPEKKNGVLLLDLGGGSTGFAAYADGYLIHTGVIGVGGDHITNDIAYAFQTTQPQAEDLKIYSSCAVVGGNEGEARIKLPGTSPLMEMRTVSRRALDTVVNARVREILCIIREELSRLGIFHRLHAGVVITGGGAALLGLPKLIQRELAMQVRVGIPDADQISGFADDRNPEAFAAVAGALLYAHHSTEEKQSFFSKLLSGRR